MAGKTRYYWCAPEKDRVKGFTPKSESLGTDYAAACRKAATLNAALASWRSGGASDGVVKPGVGTLDWIASEYRTSAKFRKLGTKTRKDYATYLDRVLAMRLKDGRQLGHVSAHSVGTAVIETVYDRIRFPEPNVDRARAARMCIQVWRRAWNVAAQRHVHRKGVMPTHNPWTGIEASTKTVKVPAATLAELETFVATADRMGEWGIGMLARVMWDLSQRMWHVIDLLDWDDYRPGETITIEDTKVEGATRTVELVTTIEDAFGLPTVVSLFPELETRLASVPETERTGLIVTRPDGKPWRLPSRDTSYLTHRCRAILDAASLPHLQMRSFRRGGITQAAATATTATELQALTGHRNLTTAAGYVDQQALGTAARARRIRKG